MQDSHRPRIGIIGTGAIGGFYGLMLARAGHDVHFLLRSEYAAVAEHGLRLNSAVHGQLHLQPVQAWDNADDMPPCDWLLVGVKTTANAELAALITRLAAPQAKVVLLQNGLAVEEQLRPLLPESLHLLGGLCFICTHRSAPGVIEHQALGAVNLGYHSGPDGSQESARRLVAEGVALFHSAGIESTAMDDLTSARWQKLVWNVPYNGLSVLLDAGTSKLMANAESRQLIEDLMLEVVQGAAACGYRLPADYPRQLLTATERMPDYLPSMYHDFAHRRPLELEAIYAAPLSAAATAGCELPKMRMLLQALRFLDES